MNKLILKGKDVVILNRRLTIASDRHFKAFFSLFYRCLAQLLQLFGDFYFKKQNARNTWNKYLTGVL
jgi:hypothetical protein